MSSSRGVALGLGLVRLAALAGGLAATAISLAARLPWPLAVLPGLSGIGYAWAPGGSGRSLHETVRAAGGFVGRRAVTRQCTQGIVFVGVDRTVAPPWWPRPLRAVRIERVTIDGSEWGLVVTGRRLTQATVVFGVAGDPRFRVLATAQQAELVSRWASVLAEAAGAGLRRLSWIERVAPVVAPDADGPDSYQQLLTDAAGVAVDHQVVVAATAPLPRGDLSVPAEAWRLVGQRLGQAGLMARPLGPATVAGLLRGWASGWRGPTQLPLAGPGLWRESWRHLATAGRVHRGYVVVAWPRVPVGPGWLDPLLGCAPAGVERTVACHLETIPARRAAQQVASARAAHAIEDDQRARWGFLSGAAARRAAEEVEARDDELAAGYVAQRVAAVVVVSAPDHNQLRGACRQVEAAALAARLELRPLDGEHGPAWAATLPAGLLAWRGR